MKIIRPTLVLLIILFILISCRKSNNENYIVTNYKAEVEKFKSFFNKQPFKTISSKYDDEYMARIIYPSGIDYNGYCGIVYTYKCEKTNFDSVYNLIKSKAIFKSELKNNDNFYIPSYKKDSKINKYPKINLNDPFQNLNKEINPEYAEIFIFNSANGNFFNNKGIEEVIRFGKLNRQEFSGNGFSNGAVIDNSNNFFIYWTIIF